MRIIMKVVAHAVAIAGVVLSFYFALFLGLQVDPMYGNFGVVFSVVLLALYVYLGFIRK